MAFDTVETLSYRVDSLEDMMRELTRNVNRTTQSVELLSREMRDFKKEMADFKKEMREFKEELRQDTAEFKHKVEQDTAELKHKVEQATTELKQELQNESRKLNQHLASLSDKMGTMAEDMVAPSIPRILKEVVGCTQEAEMIGVRIRKRLADGRSQEYDVVATCQNYILINETKSRLRPEHLQPFRELLQNAHDFFPEYKNHQVIGALATFYVDPSLIKAGERQGFIMLGVIDGLMEPLNQAGFVPTSF